MGRVWAARRVGATVQRLVAVKTARPEFGHDSDFARTFVDEARIASCIQHPNVCGIHELGNERGFAYLVMEWSDGATLHEVVNALPEKKLTPSVAARIIASVCSGLHAAHELEDTDGMALNVIHRDVSPQNVLISTSGHVKVADFGVAKAAGQLHAPTQTGEVKGKLSYMAPEQVTSKHIDRRVDIFALGCVLYEATLGERPFHGVDALATMYKILEGEPDRPTLKDPTFPSELEAIILKALAKDPNERFQTAEDMRRALEGWLHATRTIVTEAQIGKLVTTALGERIRSRNTRINEAARRLDSDEADTEIEASEYESSGGPPAATPSEGTLSKGNWANSGIGKGRNYGRVALIGGGIAAVLAVGIGLWANSQAKPTAAPVSSVANPTATSTQPTTPEAPKRVTITVRAEPSDAQITIDGRGPVPNPHVFEVEQDDRSHLVRVEAPGYLSASEEVKFDHNQTVAVVLAKEPIVSASSKVNRRQPVSTRTPTVTGQQVDAAGERTPGTLPGTLPPPTPKKKRQLDTDNPFEQD